MTTPEPLSVSRRDFSKSLLAAGAAATLGSLTQSTRADAGPEPLFQISLAEWSLHKTLFVGLLSSLSFLR